MTIFVLAHCCCYAGREVAAVGARRGARVPHHEGRRTTRRTRTQDAGALRRQQVLVPGWYVL